MTGIILLILLVIYIIMARIEYNRVSTEVYEHYYRSNVKPLHNRLHRNVTHVEAMISARKEAAQAAVAWPIRALEEVFRVVFKRSDNRYLKIREQLDEEIPLHEGVKIVS